MEIDKCEWSTIATRDVWKIATDGTIRAGLDGRCLTLAGNLEARSTRLKAVSDRQ